MQIARAALAFAVVVFPAIASANCPTDALGKRDLYIRGSFNGWSSPEEHKFRKRCDRLELVTTLRGQHEFKVADDEWSSGADWGLADKAVPPSWRLAPKGSHIHHRFDGTHRLVLTMTTNNTPQLSIESCPAPSQGQNVLFLRGAMNNWASLDDYAFTFHCDAYYLNVNLQGRQEFKIADASWTSAATWGGEKGTPFLVERERTTGIASGKDGNLGNLVVDFNGEHTLRLEIVAGHARLSIGPKTFADRNAAQVKDPLALSVKFDSRNIAHKSPFGATPRGAEATWQVSAAPGVASITLVVEKRTLEGNQERLDYTEVARIPMQREAAGKTERWLARHTFDAIGVHGYWFELMACGKTYHYQNNRDAIYWTREKGSNGAGQIEDAAADRKSIRRFRHTVFDPAFKAPTWAKDAIYYYIFPDRFRNGDKANDPKPGRDRYQKHDVEFHKTWLDRPYKPGTGDGSDAVYNNDFFGGDLAGILDKLGYIQDLGANTIYMTPVFRAASNHKYDTADYRNIDPAFGTNEEFERLVREAKKHGMRLIPDASFNHTGSDSIYFDRFGNFDGKGAFANGKINKDSPYASWYTFDATQSDPDKQYRGWVDVKDLPELNKMSQGWRDFVYAKPESVTQLWLKRGAAGWRMDVAPWVPDDFWREWRKAVKAVNPEAITISETWFDASKHLTGDMFDSTMNYIFRNALIDYVKGGSAKALMANLELIREVYPVEAQFALMNLLSSHDVARTLHVLGYESDKTPTAQIDDAKQRFKLAVFLQMTHPGSPAIYYGDEAGMTGGDDPYNRGTYPWADLGGKPDEAMRAYFKQMTTLRNQHAVFRHGEAMAPLFVDDQVVVMARRLGNTWALVALNNGNSDKAIRVTLPAMARSARWKPLLDVSKLEVNADAVTLNVPALRGAAWIGE
jgi:glycosidase